MTKKIWSGLAMAIAAGAIAAGTIVVSQDDGGSTPVPTGTAHIWVDGSGTCVDNATPVAYDSATACATFDNANDTCDNGDTVKVVGGTYANGDFTGSNSRSSACIFEEAEGQSVEINNDLDFSDSAYISVEGFELIGGTSASPVQLGMGGGGVHTANNITAIDITAVPGRVFFKGRFLSVIGGEFGGYNSCDSGQELDGIQVGRVDNVSASTTDVLLDGVYVHDVRKNPTSCSNAHTDCLQFLGITNGIIRNNRFVNCPTIGILARPQEGSESVVDNLLIENNFIGPVLDGTEGFNIGSDADICTNVVIRYNTFPADTGTFDCGGGGSSGNALKGNYVGGSASCGDASVTYSYNRWSSGACGSNAATCTPTFVDAATHNYHIQSSDTCLKGAGDNSSHPATDYDGDVRSPNVDIGADEIAN